MERVLVKTGIYSLICSLAVGILFIEKVGYRITSGNMYTFYEKTLVEYILELLRFSIRITIILVAVTFLYTLYRNYKRKKR